ncbi:MAG: hypothetical protein V1743_08500 [Nanoarchaeota archaeon]
MQKRGQFTIFVILGITLLIIFALAFYLYAVITETTPNMDQEINSFTKSINPLVTDCLELVTAEAVKKAGEQGGDLYDAVSIPDCTDGNDNTPCIWLERTNDAGNPPPPVSQPGLDHLSYTDSSGKPVYVSYGIKRNTNPPPTFNWNDETYPKAGYLLADPPSSLYFGDNGLRRLCDQNGPNQQRPGFVLSCAGSSYDWVVEQMANFSIQEQLSFYVKMHIGQCAKLSSYTAKGLVFNVGEPLVNITFGEADITADLHYPISFSQGSKRQARTLSYTAKLNVRLKKVYEYVNALIEQDIKDLHLDLSSAGSGFQTVAGYDNVNFQVQRRTTSNVAQTFVQQVDNNNNPPRQICIPSGCDLTKDDIIEITDAASLIQGRPFLFRMAVQNRRPVLDEISLLPFLVPCPGPSALTYSCTITIPLNAIDPDDESVLFAVPGWTIPASNPTANLYTTSASNTFSANIGDSIFGSVTVSASDVDLNSKDLQTVNFQCSCTT